MSKARPLALLLFLGCAPDAPPRILSVALSPATQDSHGPYRIEASIDDDHEVTEAFVLFRARGDTSTTTQILAHQGGVAYSGDLAAQPLGTVLEYTLVARDEAGQESRAPETGRSTLVVGNVPSRPELLTLWPDRGPTSGGTEVLLVGRDLRPMLSARFGAGGAVTRDVLSRTQAVVRTPPGPEGPVDVAVTNLDGGAVTLARGFTYFPAPEVLRVEPPSGPSSGGTRVAIIGRRFAAGMRFLFAGAQATDVQIVSSERALALTPPGPAGLVDVRVEHDTLGFGVRPDAYEYVPPPVVARVDPDHGPDTGGTVVIVIGSAFQPGARVRFDGLAATGVRFLGPDRIRAVTPAHPPGSVTVEVENADGQRGHRDDAYLYQGPPELRELVPPYAATRGGATVRVRGANLSADETLIEMAVDGAGNLAPAACTAGAPGELSCVTPMASAVGPHLVRATSLIDGRLDSLPGGITYFDLTSVTPPRGPSSGGTAVQVRGRFLPRVAVSFGAAPAPCQQQGDLLACITPPGPPNQFVDVGALPPDPGQVAAILVDGYFYVPPPEITALEPDHGPQRGGTVVTIRGNFFQPGITVTVGGAPCANLVFVSSSELRCTVPPHAAGTVLVVAENPDGQSGSFDGYTYVPVTFSPGWGLVDGFVTLTVRGAEFSPAAQVRIGGVPGTRFRFISSEELQVEVPASMATGSVPVEVRNPGVAPDVSPDPFSYRVYRPQSPTGIGGSGETTDVMVLDLDNDGDNDAVFVNGTGQLPEDSQAMENLGNGAFLAHPFGVVDASNEGNHCDFDGDGLQDLIWGSSGSFVRLWRNLGGMRFRSITPPGMPSDSFETSFHDVTGDGRCDLINVGIQSPDAVLENQGGSFRAIPNAIPDESGFVHDHKVDSGDLDGDGDSDLVIVVDDVNFPSETQRHRVYRNDGTGRFIEDMTNAPLMRSIHGDIYDVRVGDMDQDGDLDVVMPNFNQPPVLLKNDGAGALSLDTTTLPQSPAPESALLLADVEGDGDLDLYLLALEEAPGGETSRLFLSDGRGGYFRASRGEPQLPPAAYRAALGDLDGDGRNDLLLGVVFGPNALFVAAE